MTRSFHFVDSTLRVVNSREIFLNFVGITQELESGAMYSSYAKVRGAGFH